MYMNASHTPGMTAFTRRWNCSFTKSFTPQGSSLEEVGLLSPLFYRREVEAQKGIDSNLLKVTQLQRGRPGI